MSNEMKEWEALVSRREIKVKGGIVVGLLLVIAAAVFVDGSIKPWMWGWAAAFGGFGLYMAWAIFLRPPSSHPFIKVLASRGDDVTRSFVYEHYINGSHSATWLTLELKDQKQVKLNIPRGQHALWQHKLKALLPHADHSNEGPSR